MTKFNVPDMSCGHCKAAIEKSMAAADSAAKLEFDMEERTVVIESVLADDALTAALKDAGYDSSIV